MCSFSATTRKIAFVLLAACLTGAASAQILSKAELKKAIATASTPADHERIARHFDAKAAQYEADAKDHEELAAEYKAEPTGSQKHPMSPLTAEHCLYFAKELRRAAEEARQLARDHRAMAKPAGK